MKENMIDCQNISFKYMDINENNSKLAVNGVTFQVKKGEILAILGRNGSGKSTIAKHINALLVPTSGKMYIENMDTSDEKDLWNIRQNVRYDIPKLQIIKLLQL